MRSPTVCTLRSGPGSQFYIPGSRWTVALLQEIAALLLLGYVLSRRNLKISNLGLRWSIREVWTGLLIAGISCVSYIAGSMLVQLVHYAAYGSFARGANARDFFAHPSAMIIPFTLVNPFFEELIVRAYLMTEVLELTGSAALAVTLSVAIQFVYHLYYGWVGAISILFGLVPFALYYSRSRKALPIVVAHGLFDIYGLIRMW